MVTRNLHLHVVRGRWSREIHGEVRALRRGVWQSVDEAQEVNLYPRNILMAGTTVSWSDIRTSSNQGRRERTLQQRQDHFH